MEQTQVLKAIADETRLNILTLLLRHNHCVRALARKLGLTEATVSQHLKILKEAGLLTGEKRGYFMHYDVNRDILRELAQEIQRLTDIERESCNPERGGCPESERRNCHIEVSETSKEEESGEAEEFCSLHEGMDNTNGCGGHRGHRQCRRS